MDNYEDADANFEAVFSFKPNIAYDQQKIDLIIHNRGALENELFVDRLLKTLGIAKGELSSSQNGPSLSPQAKTVSVRE